MRPARDRTALGYALLDEPINYDPAHIRAVMDRVGVEPDALVLLEMLGLTSNQNGMT